MNLRLLLCALLCAAGLLRAEPKVVPTRLNVTSDPPGAEVLIDGVPYGTAPYDSGDLAPGDYLITVRIAGCAPEYRTLSLTTGERRSVRVRLEPLAALLLVHSSPTGATITIDGADHGITPALISTLSLGSHRLRIAATGYLPKEIELNLADRTPRKVQVDLASDSGTLHVTAAPDGAEVLVNGIPRGTAPCTLERIPVGEVELTVRAAGFLPFTQTLRLAAGESQTLHAPLAAQPARVQVVSIPAGGRVYVDNEFRGETPLDLADLAAGEHRLRVELAGHDVLARTLTFARGEQRTEEFRLSANTGRLEITTEPAGAAVFIDGQRSGETAATPGDTTRVSAPLAVESLADGEHELRVVRKGCFDKSQKITVNRGRTLTLHVALLRRFIPDTEISTARGVYTGVLVSRDDTAIRLETAPGVVQAFPLKDIRAQRLLGVDEPAP